MAKKIKTGSVEVGDESFDDANAIAHISIRLPLILVKDLRRLALTEKYQGKYQVLIRDVLTAYVNTAPESQKQLKRRRA